MTTRRKRFAPINPIGAGATAPTADSPAAGQDWQASPEFSEEPEQQEEPVPDATTPRDHDAATGPQQAPTAPRGRGRGKETRQAPRVAEARAMTVRMDPDEADQVDRFVLDLRDETGQRLDKAEVVRELLRLAQLNPSVRRALVKRLR